MVRRSVIAVLAFCLLASGEIREASAQSSAGTGGGTSAPQTVAPLRSAGTNRSGTVTTTAATLMQANPNRQGWKGKNDCTVAVWVNFDTVATAAPGSGNIQISPGSYASSESNFVETGAMSAITATGSCALTFREY